MSLPSICSTILAFLPIIAAFAQSHTVIINELMIDPNPTVGLPNVEYIEIYNYGTAPVVLDELFYCNGATKYQLPKFTLDSHDFILVTDQADIDQLQQFGAVIGIPNLQLTNTRDVVSITDSLDRSIHEVAYDPTWYRNSLRSQGGWSLEMINPRNLCERRENWSTSVAAAGGTPGRQNSVLDTTHVIDLQFDLVPEAQMLTIGFNKSVDDSHLSVAVDGDTSIISSWELFNSQTLLIKTRPLSQDQQHQLLLIGLRDCRGHDLTLDEIPFVVAVQASPTNLIINELLFDPAPGVSDFVEITNTSDNWLILHDCQIGNLVKDDRGYAIPTMILRPDQYLVFTEDRAAILDSYEVENPRDVHEITLPSWSDDSGNVTVFRWKDGIREHLDAYDYSRDQHLQLLADPEGVSLERISPSAPTNDPGNWQSAAESVGFATPTKVNSQHLDIDHTSTFTITPKVFSPDQDGFDDFLLIQMKSEPGVRLSAYIYDLSGKMIRNLANHSTLGAEDHLKWDGTDVEGRQVPLGMYVILVEAFHESGKVRKWVETCAVAKRL